MEKVMLNNGVTMPVLGFGVFQIPDAKECERCVLDAIEVGYRSIDTAQIYGNEEAVGRAAEKSGVPREELFLTTKVWISNGGLDGVKASHSARPMSETQYCASCARIIWICCSSTSLSTITTALTGPWKKRTGPERSAPLA